MDEWNELTQTSDDPNWQCFCEWAAEAGIGTDPEDYGPWWDCWRCNLNNPEEVYSTLQEAR